MTTSEYLASLGITMQQAHDFIFAHLNEAALIYDTAVQYHVDSMMLSEIVGGVTQQQVRDFFDSHGLDSSVLEPPAPSDPRVYDTVPDDWAMLVGVAPGADAY
jgi:hypothetical protein